MPGSVFAKTLRDLRGVTLAWGLGLVAMAVANVYGFRVFNQMPGLVEFMENLPPALKSLVGNVEEMARLEGFMRAKVFDSLPLLLAVFGVTQGAQIIAGELEHKTLDLLMAQPIHRWRVVLQKYLALVLVTVILCVAMALGLMGFTALAGVGTNHRLMVVGTLSALPLTLVFVSLAVLGSCIYKRVRHAAILAGAVIVISYTFEIFQLMIPALGGWGWASLCAHHKASFNLAGAVDATPVIGLSLLAMVVAAAAAIVWERKDLAS